MKGKLIVIESGTDASGKATQSDKLYRRLQREGYASRKIEFPNYDSRSSALVRMYLEGEFGDEPGDVNPYAASTFFAVDRYASFCREWREPYLAGEVIIADRYTTSNMVHQASKIMRSKARQVFLDWLQDLEFTKFALPAPDIVIFLDIPPEISDTLMRGRENRQRDIHEEHRQYLQETYKNAAWVARRYNWQRVECLRDGKIKSISEIHEEIYRLVSQIL